MRAPVPTAIILCLATVCIGSAMGSDGRSDQVSSPGPDLYRVYVRSQADADALTRIGADAIVRMPSGYLVLAEAAAAGSLENSGLEYALIAAAVDWRRLALDSRHDRSNLGRYRLLYEEGEVRLFQVERADLLIAERGLGLAAIRGKRLPIVYRAPRDPITGPDIQEMGLDSLVDLISQDSLESYSAHLQSYSGRASGTNYNYVSAFWAADKLAGFGYDSVVVDDFYAFVGGRRIKCKNIIAYKPGTVYPFCHIVIGAHRDTELHCPGADDNGSGMAGVLEAARVLAGVDTRMTIVLALFDAEEAGLLGSAYYVDRASEIGQPIVLMLNMDMIAHYENDTEAKLFHDDNDVYAQLWADLAASIPSIDITGHLMGPSAGSDHYSFWEAGYDAVFVHEYILSPYLHTPQDSTTYLDFDYMTRMVKATLAEAIAVDSLVTPPRGLMLSYLDSIPALIRPGIPPTIRVGIQTYAGGEVVPGSVHLNYIIDGTDSAWLPAVAVDDGIFELDFPPLECGNTIEFYVSAEEAGGGMFYTPDPDRPSQAVAAPEKTVVFADDFSTDLGWSVSGDAVDGQWERVVNSDVCGLDPNSDFDGSGYYYLTDCEVPDDVDGGTTCLKSPEIPAQPGDIYIEYALWYMNSFYGEYQDDVFKVWLYDGPGCMLAETIGPDVGTYEECSWELRRLHVNDFFAPNQTIGIRFDASDKGVNSIVEAAIDAVRVIVYSYTPSIATETLPEGTAGSPYLYELVASGCATPLAWTDKFDDLAGSGLTLSAEGLISGTPPDTGVFAFTAVVTDTAGYTDEQAYSLHIQTEYVCGDANRDGIVNVADAVYIINYVFKAGPVPVPLEAGDANADGAVNVADAVYLINYVFKNGPGPSCP